MQGMEFIHKSNMKYHGNLKPTTCLVDSRLQIKLSGFGLWEFKKTIATAKTPSYEGQWLKSPGETKQIYEVFRDDNSSGFGDLW